MIRAGLSSYDNYSRLRDRRRKVIRFLFFVLVLQYSLTLVGSLLLNSRSLATGESTVDLPSGTRMLLSPLPVGGRIPPFPFQLPSLGNLSRGDLLLVRPNSHEEAPLWLRAADEFLAFLSFGHFSLAQTLRPEWDRPETLLRLVGLPGDQIYLENHTAFIKTADNNFFLSEYEISRSRYNVIIPEPPASWDRNLPLSGYAETIVLGEGEYYLLADNRGGRGDSSLWGPVGGESLLAKVLMVYWPLSHWGSY